MKVYDIKDQQGQVFAFEIKNFGLWLGRVSVRIIVSMIPSVKIIRAPYFFQYFGDEEFCEFEVDGQRFIVWEPYNDSSVYWIGSKPTGWCEQLEIVRTTFLNYSQWGHLRQKLISLLR